MERISQARSNPTMGRAYHRYQERKERVRNSVVFSMSLRPISHRSHSTLGPNVIVDDVDAIQIKLYIAPFFPSHTETQGVTWFDGVLTYRQRRRSLHWSSRELGIYPDRQDGTRGPPASIRTVIIQSLDDIFAPLPVNQQSNAPNTRHSPSMSSHRPDRPYMVLPSAVVDRIIRGRRLLQSNALRSKNKVKTSDAAPSACPRKAFCDERNSTILSMPFLSPENPLWGSARRTPGVVKSQHKNMSSWAQSLPGRASCWNMVNTPGLQWDFYGSMTEDAQSIIDLYRQTEAGAKLNGVAITPDRLPDAFVRLGRGTRFTGAETMLPELWAVRSTIKAPQESLSLDDPNNSSPTPEPVEETPFHSSHNEDSTGSDRGEEEK
ncbi:hypothetical protein M231_05880 [Tremella mesenterica]|uniref:Uncharacterized protein n=2 Tax=Tremella mesenterica TaxID=5217 RepID=A0A4Q1BH02_TREME|nr:hypothetical protein M231_05880 [Tremella mesenterica]